MFSLGSGDLAVAIADMDIFTRLLTPATVGHLNGQIRGARLVVADGNLSVDTLRALADACSSSDKPLFFEPTSDHKCVLPLQAGSMHQVIQRDKHTHLPLHQCGKHLP